MSASASRWIRLLVAILILPVSVYFVFWISLFALADLVEGWHPAWLGDSSYADVIVFLPGASPEDFTVELVPLSSTAQYVSAHPGSTFLIPMDRQSQVKEFLEKNLKLSWNSFEIKQLPNSGQEISFYFMDRTDDSHGSRYKASKDRVQLESHRYVSDRGGVGILLLAMVLTAGVHILALGYFVARAIYRRRKRRVDPSAI